MLRSFLIIAGLFASLAFSSASAAPFNEGFRKCGECHEAEVEVWKQTKHAKSYNEVHKKEEAAKILAAVGGPNNIQAPRDDAIKVALKLNTPSLRSETK